MTIQKLPVFEIPNLMKGIFVSRPNRFVGEIDYRGKSKTAHIHDPGRLKELLIKGSKVLFTHSQGKLKYYIKAVKKEEEWILIDSALHSKIALPDTPIIVLSENLPCKEAEELSCNYK